MTDLDRERCIQFIEDDYFGSVVAADLDKIRACFSSDAQVLIRHGDLAPRLFRPEPRTEGELDLMAGFYGHLCGNYAAWFGDFEHTIDTPAQRAASRFSVRLTPLADGDYAGEGVQALKNCNFFEFRDGLIQFMLIYYSNPTGGDANPTGYGKEA